MENIHIPAKYINRAKTISSLKVLVVYLTTVKELNSSEIELSMADLSKKSGMSINAIRTGIKELIELRLIEQLERKKGKEKTRYRVNVSEFNILKVDTQETQREGYKLATASKNKSQKEEIQEDIKSIDFNNMDFYTEDINSLSLINKNTFMTHDELKKLANRVIKEVFLPLAKPRVPTDSRALAVWYAQQNKQMVTLLIEYRTEQIIAAIKYWTQINPQLILSVRFLTFVRGGRNNIIQSLDYYKQQYLANEHEYNKVDIEQMEAEKKVKEQLEKEAQDIREQEVAKLSSEEFIASMMGRHKIPIFKKE